MQPYTDVSLWFGMRFIFFWCKIFQLSTNLVKIHSVSLICSDFALEKMCVALEGFTVSNAFFLFPNRNVDFTQNRLAPDVLGAVFWSVRLEETTFCTLNETLLFPGWREAKWARTS